MVVATPEYLEKHGRPERPQDLERHARVVFAPRREPRAWRFENVDGPGSHVPSGNFQTGDAEQIRAAVLADMGLVQAPAWLFAAEIASGAVISVLPDFAPAPMPIHAFILPAGACRPRPAFSSSSLRRSWRHIAGRPLFRPAASNVLRNTLE
ncbi:MAG TPA: LysR substrate-binding domain-containing protein [Paraburkholderia sp.]|nr:LysR substrate-binding domain-containing protein [Paraburkholderia sp.]